MSMNQRHSSKTGFFITSDSQYGNPTTRRSKEIDVLKNEDTSHDETTTTTCCSGGETITRRDSTTVHRLYTKQNVLP